MNQNKKIIISLGIFFSVILLSISMLKISINILYPVNELSNSLKDSFKDIFGKAIKFDTLYFKYNGDIVLQNFYLSNKSDFNDNINLIKCDEIIIDTNLFDLIRKKITFAGVYMSGPEITFIKNFGKSYYEIFIQDISGSINKDKAREFITNGFRFELTGSTLQFRETFRNSKSEINFSDLDIKIKYKNDSIQYRTYGNIEDKNRDSWFGSKYRITGKVYLNRKYSESEFEVENFDLTHLNNLINDSFTLKTFLSGNFTGKLNIVNDDGVYKCKGSIDTSSLNLFYYNADTPYPFFNKKDIESNFSFSLSEKLDRLTVQKLKLDDGTVELSSTLDYSENDFFSIDISSNRIDLGELSETLVLFKNCRYDGDLSFMGVCSYKLKEKMPEKLSFNVILNQFNIIPEKNNSESFSDIKNGHLKLIGEKDKISIKTNFKSGKSDFNIAYNSDISSWNPFRSSNQVEITSKIIELELLKNAAVKTIKEIYSLANVDMFQNFDEQRNFLKEPEGIFINNNNAELKLNAEKIAITEKSFLNNLSINLALVKGVLKTSNFTLEGYNGVYSFNLYSALNQEYPYFKLNAEAKDLDLDKISYDSGLTYSFGGLLSLDAKFETNAFRIGQVVENGNAGINMTIKNGYFNNLPVQNKINDLLSKNGYRDIFNKKTEFSSFSFSLMQSGTNFYIKNFFLNALNSGFNSYGSYTEDNGLKVPVNLNYNNGKTIDRVPLEIYGTLEAPCIKIKSKNESDSVCF